LQLAYRQRQGPPLDILLITDGEVWNVEELITEAQRAGCRIFTVGVGAAVAEGLVRGLAEATGGAGEFVHPDEDMAARIVRHFERIRAPRAEAAVIWPGEPTRRLPERVERVFSSDTVHLLAWLPAQPAGPATLNLTLSDGQCLSQTVMLEPWPVAETADALPRLAAARRIPQLSAADATALAVEYQLVTPHTHFLMVDVRAEGEKATELPELRTVPHMLAAGWGGVGSVAGTVRCMAAMEADSDNYLDMLDMPAFLRREPLPSPPAPMAAPASTARLKCQVSGRDRAIFDPSQYPAGSPLRFVGWLEANAARLADQKQPLPMLDELADALPDDLLARLRELVAQGEAEEAVVAALLHAFLQHGPRCQLPHNASRNIRARFQKQVSATLAAAVEPLVEAWCATG